MVKPKPYTWSGCDGEKVLHYVTKNRRMACSYLRDPIWINKTAKKCKECWELVSKEIVTEFGLFQIEVMVSDLRNTHKAQHNQLRKRHKDDIEKLRKEQQDQIIEVRNLHKGTP